MESGLLEKILQACRPLTESGRVATYIPELQNTDPEMLGICVAQGDGTLSMAGDARIPFTIQSISKILIFTCCLLDNPLERVLQTVSLEPSSDAFNAISNLESKNYSRPLNPMINAGAIASLTLVAGETPQDKFRRVLELARILSGNPELDINRAVYLSEKSSGSRNRALAYYMESTGIIQGEIEALLDAYFRACSIEINCVDLAKIGLAYAENGVAPGDEPPYFSREIARTVKAVMTLCGMYDESGQVAVDVGLPSKSGVGGGILSVVPGRMGIGVFGPALSPKGSSVAGLAALKMLSEELDLNIF